MKATLLAAALLALYMFAPLHHHGDHEHAHHGAADHHSHEEGR